MDYYMSGSISGQHSSQYHVLLYRTELNSYNTVIGKGLALEGVMTKNTSCLGL